MRVTILHKNRHQMPPHLLSHQWHEVEVGRGKEVSRAKVILVSFFETVQIQFGRYLHEDRLVSIGIFPIFHSKRTFRDVKQEISVCFRKVRLTNNSTKSWKKRQFPKKEEQTTTPNGSGNCENCISDGLCLARLGSIGFSKRKTSLGKPNAKNLGTDSKGYDSLSLRYVKQGQSLGKKTSQNSSSAKSLRYEIWGPVPRRLKDNSDAPEAKHGTLPNTCTSFKKRRKLHSTRPRKNGYSRAASTKEPEERDSGASMHMVSKKDLNSAELETMKDIEKSDDGDNGQRQGANKKRGHGTCQRIGHIRDGCVSWRNSRSSFSREALRGSWVHWTSGQKPTSHQKGKIIYCSFQTMYHLWSLVYQRVPLRRPHLLLHHLHHSIPYLMSTDTPKIQYPKEVEVRARSYGETRRMNQQKQKIKNKNEGRKEVQSDLLHDLPDWLQEFKENLVDESSPAEPRGNPEPGHRGTSSSSHELPMESRAKVEPDSGEHSISTFTSRKTQTAISAWRRK